MAQQFQPSGPISVEVLGDVPSRAYVTGVSVGAASGIVGSVIHGFRIEVALQVAGAGAVTLTLGAADALQLAEEIRAAANRREDVKRV